jgi:hypothetical protein
MQLDEEKKHKALIKAETLAEEFDPKEAEGFAQKHKSANWYDDFILLFKMITDKEFDISIFRNIFTFCLYSYAL